MRQLLSAPSGVLSHRNLTSSRSKPGLTGKAIQRKSTFPLQMMGREDCGPLVSIATEQVMPDKRLTQNKPVMQNKTAARYPKPVVQRFQVGLKVADEHTDADRVISGLSFTGRPPDTYLEGGDPRGTKRHVISVQLEYEAVRSLLVGKTIGQAARMVGSETTINGVSEGIKRQLAARKPQRLQYQGSQEGNDRLAGVAKDGLALMNKSRDHGLIINEEGFREGVKLAYIGTLDVPPASVKSRLDPGALWNTINLHWDLFQKAFNVPAEYMPDKSVIDSLVGSSGDEYSTKFYNYVQGAKAGASLADAGLFGHFKLDSTNRGPQSLLQGGTYGGGIGYVQGAPHGGGFVYPQGGFSGAQQGGAPVYGPSGFVPVHSSVPVIHHQQPPAFSVPQLPYQHPQSSAGANTTTTTTTTRGFGSNIHDLLN